jgi:hypothetical protein
MVCNWSKGALVLAVGLLSGCATQQDAKSRELVAISHLASEPVGTLSISDDKTYTYLPNGKAERQGTLSSTEFDTLQPHVTRLALQALYAFGEANSDRCQLNGDSYTLNSVVGASCFLLANISDPTAHDNLQYFVTLFADKAAAP